MKIIVQVTAVLLTAGSVLLSGSAGGMAQTGQVTGQGVMDDKNRAGPDGWAQFPLPRVEAPSGKAPGEEKKGETAEFQQRSVPDTGKNLKPGEDPGTPTSGPQGDPASRSAPSSAPR